MYRFSGQRWAIFRYGECKECHPLRGLRDRFAARQWLQQVKGNPLAMGALRQMLSREGSVSWRMDRATDDEIIDHAAQLIGFGIWHVHEPGKVHRRTDSQSLPGEKLASDTQNQSAAPQKAAGSATQTVLLSEPRPKPAAPATRQLTWIEIQLMDEDRQPVPNVAYRVKLPDGSVKTGTLNAQGIARCEQIVPGQCEVSFPDLHGEDWDAA